MKITVVTRLASLCLFALILPFTGCSTRKEVQHTGKASPFFHDTAEQIKAMPPCRATVERKVVCYAVLRRADGKQFHIGSPGNTAEVHGFVDTLEKGQTCRLPHDFLTYQKKTRQ